VSSLPVVHSPRYFADLGPHVMPIRKFGLVREAIERCGAPVTIEAPEPVTDTELLRVHTAAYVAAVTTGAPQALAESQKFPWSKGLAEAVRWTNGGCVLALRRALETGCSGNLASGFHHAHADHGEGFCTFNGLVVAMEALRAEGRFSRALVVDLDLHYGNGTASLLASRPWAHQLSCYGNGYEQNRAIKDVTAFVAPDTENCRSVALRAGLRGAEHLRVVADALDAAFERSRPDVVLFQAGADPYREDPYSPLLLDHPDLAERDQLVFEACFRRGVPVMWVLAGGYTEDVSKVVAVHLGTFLAAHRVFGGRR
jgi:acetoin utilization deacetylase AcuC-like enzyme